MNHRGLLKLSLKLLLVLMPLLLPVLVYVVFDPFEVLRKYDRHYNDPRIVYNRDYNTTETFMSNYVKQGYDSFIFGNSRSLAFHCRDWNRYIKAKSVYHFDASAESLYGIYKKIIFLDERGVNLKNCLLILDDVALAKSDNHKGHIAIKHPKVSRESALDFHLEFLRAFMTPRFLTGFLDYKIRNRIVPDSTACLKSAISSTTRLPTTYSLCHWKRRYRRPATGIMKK